MVLIEFLTVACATYLASTIYYRVILLRWPPSEQYVPAAFFASTLVMLASLGFRQFVAIGAQPLHRFLWNGLGAVAVAFSFFLSAIFILKIGNDYSRGTFFCQFIGVAAATSSVRTLGYAKLHSAISSGRVEARRAVLIGDPAHSQQLMDRLVETGIHTVAAFPFPTPDRDHRVNDANGIGGDKVNVTKIIGACRVLQPDDILILTTPSEMPAVSSLVEGLSEVPASLHALPAGIANFLASSTLANLGSVVTIQLIHIPLSVFDQFVKRAFDLVAASLGLILLSPLFLIVSIAIKLESPGPAFFRQTRHGYNNETFRVFKFRSMTTIEDGSKFIQAVKNDPRATPIGRILRRSSIDELPQLINILLGDMSIVGPRPHPVSLNERFEAQISPFSRRHNVKPGLTGWAQVNGYRGETDALEKMQRRLAHDLYYIDNWSFLFDMKIILMTLFSKKTYTNAY
jgi:Undecaprenyl-phosphate glucose phosphotransferase